MTNILVHLHLFYHDQLDYFLEKLSNIEGVNWDLVVTSSSWPQESIEKLKQFKSDVIIEETENFGYDIWPFIKVVKNTDLSKYDYVIKLHTKRKTDRIDKVNVIPLTGFEWRNALVDAILLDKPHFKSILDKFSNDVELGMMSSLLTYTPRDHYEEYIRKELKALHMDKMATHQCMGSMFIIRASLLKPLQSEVLNADRFKGDLPKSGTLISLSHIYERIFSHLPINQGFRHDPVCLNKSHLYKIKATRALESVFQAILCIDRRGPERKKFIRVLGIKVYEEKVGKRVEDVNKLKELYE